MRSFKRNLLRFLWKHPGMKTGTTLSPAILGIALLIVAPMLIVLYDGFLTSDPQGALLPHFTLDNYQKIFVAQDLRTGAPEPTWLYLNVFLRSFLLALLTTVISLLLGYPVAYWIALRGGRHKNLWIGLFILPFWTSYLVRIFAWIFLLRDPSGFVNQALLQMHLIQAPVQLLYNMTGVLVGMVYTYLPFAVIPLYASLERLDRSILEGAFDLGARPWQRLRWVTLPLTRGGILSASVLVFVPSIGEYLIPQLMGGAKVTMIGNIVADKFLRDQNWAFGAALSIGLIALVMLMLLVYFKLSRSQAVFERRA
jgi:spermidine/putrescine transport system permease protein